MYLAAVGGVVAMLAARCLKVDDIADALKLDVILLIAASLALARENGLRAAENADSYRYFVETLPRS